MHGILSLHPHPREVDEERVVLDRDEATDVTHEERALGDPELGAEHSSRIAELVMSMPLGTTRILGSLDGGRRKRKREASSLHATPAVMARTRTAEAALE